MSAKTSRMTKNAAVELSEHNQRNLTMNARTRQQKSIAHTEALVAREDMYRRRRSPRMTSGDANRWVIQIDPNTRLHFKKGYRHEHGRNPIAMSSLLVISVPTRSAQPSPDWDRAHPPTNGAREKARRLRQKAEREL